MCIRDRFYETQELSGPYAPLSRFGEYQVFAEKDGEKLPIYATFDQASEQTRAVKALPVSYTHLDVSKRQDFVKVGNQMEARISARQLRGALDAIYDRLGESFRGVDGTRVPAPAAVQPSITTATAPGITRESFVASVKRAFPHLSGSLDKVLARGEQGQAGGTVLVDSNNLVDIAQVYACLLYTSRCV